MNWDKSKHDVIYLNTPFAPVRIFKVGDKYRFSVGSFKMPELQFDSVKIAKITAMRFLKEKMLEIVDELDPMIDSLAKDAKDELTKATGNKEKTGSEERGTSNRISKKKILKRKTVKRFRL